MKRRFIADLFTPEPSQWGLRGDPLLWRDMQAHLSDRPLPETAEDLEQEIQRMFEQLTGRPFTDRTDFHLAKYESYGMSGGFISPAFWQDEAVPLLKRRLASRT